MLLNAKRHITEETERSHRGAHHGLHRIHHVIRKGVCRNAVDQDRDDDLIIPDRDRGPAPHRTPSGRDRTAASAGLSHRIDREELPDAGGRRDRGHRALQRPPPAVERFCNFNRLHGSLGTRRRKRCSGRREGPSVNGHRQLHTGRLQGPGVRIGWNPAEQCCFKYR